jgi:hypothetical protein
VPRIVVALALAMAACSAVGFGGSFFFLQDAVDITTSATHEAAIAPRRAPLSVIARCMGKAAFRTLAGDDTRIRHAEETVDSPS